MCMERPVLQVEIHITGDTVLRATFTCALSTVDEAITNPYKAMPLHYMKRLKKKRTRKLVSELKT